jgi:hypothetical protein
MYYANGVALAADESYLVICETDRIRLLKFWLTGPKVRAATWFTGDLVSGFHVHMHVPWTRHGLVKFWQLPSLYAHAHSFPLSACIACPHPGPLFLPPPDQHEQAGMTELLLQPVSSPRQRIHTAPNGNLWVALVSPIPPIAKLLRDPTVRALYAWLPSWARPPLKKWGAVVKVSQWVWGRVEA